MSAVVSTTTKPHEARALSLSGLPTLKEVQTHLLLLDAIVNLKMEVEDWVESCSPASREGDGKTRSSKSKEETWTFFTQLATLRFLKWAKALAADRAKGGEKGKMAKIEIPSLDVLMAWHTSMLNPYVYWRFEEGVLDGGLGGVGIDWDALENCLSTSGSFALPEVNRACMLSLDIEPDLLASLKAGDVETESLAFPEHRFDIPAAMGRQFGFASKMHRAGWNDGRRYAPGASELFLDRARERYAKFLKVVRDYEGGSHVPTLDIDLVWHTHQLAAGGYREWTRRYCGRVVNHNDDVEGGVLELGYEGTEEIWGREFGERYTVRGVGAKGSALKLAGDGGGEEGEEGVKKDIPKCSGGKDCKSCFGGEATPCSTFPKKAVPEANDVYAIEVAALRGGGQSACSVECQADCESADCDCKKPVASATPSNGGVKGLTLDVGAEGETHPSEVVSRQGSINYTPRILQNNSSTLELDTGYWADYSYRNSPKARRNPKRNPNRNGRNGKRDLHGQQMGASECSLQCEVFQCSAGCIPPGVTCSGGDCGSNCQPVTCDPGRFTCDKDPEGAAAEKMVGLDPPGRVFQEAKLVEDEAG
ncbi:Glycine-rich domain-containing protein 1 [Zalerion maritima]|uniref:Glycine-rich domain-containing protein 1 n=1 Tax=Zalerion maritima TaxID=339359 RepID=A0AAD5RM63_9PEZI|nr:Glycine-rich domain-containing protein 1 [Zalerion maritima]